MDIHRPLDMYSAAIGPPGCVSTYTFDAAKAVEQQRLDQLAATLPPRKKNNGEWPAWLQKDSKVVVPLNCRTVFTAPLPQIVSRAPRRGSGAHSTPPIRGQSRRAPPRLPVLTGPQVLSTTPSPGPAPLDVSRQRGRPRRGKPQFMGECRRATPKQAVPNPHVPLPVMAFPGAMSSGHNPNPTRWFAPRRSSQHGFDLLFPTMSPL